MTTTTATEYGIRKTPTGSIDWPDDDGELYFSASGRFVAGSSSEIHEDYDDADPEELRRLARANGYELFSRERTTTLTEPKKVEEPLPAIGSVVVADTVSEVYGDLGRIPLSVRKADSHPFTVLTEGHWGAGIKPSGVKNVEVIFDPAKAAA